MAHLPGKLAKSGVVVSGRRGLQPDPSTRPCTGLAVPMTSPLGRVIQYDICSPGVIPQATKVNVSPAWTTLLSEAPSLLAEVSQPFEGGGGAGVGGGGWAALVG